MTRPLVPATEPAHAPPEHCAPARPRRGWRAAALLVVAAFGCALPPPADDGPVAEEAITAPPRVDSSLPRAPGRGTDGGDPAPGPVTVGPPPARAADEGAAETTDSETAVIEVQSAATTPLVRVDDALAPADPKALERDDEATLPSTVERPLVPTDVSETVEEGVAPPPPTTVPGAAEATATSGLARKRLTRSIDGQDVPDASYLSGGTAPGRALVFVHQWGGNAEQWRRPLERLVQSHRVVAIDLPGHGASSEVERAEWTVPGYASDVIALVKAEELGDIVLVGHGMGGQIALEVAARLPKQVVGIVGVDSLQQLSGDPNLAQRMAWVERFRADFPKEVHAFVEAALAPEAPEELTDRIVRDAQAANQAALLALMEHFGKYDPRDVTRNVQCSVACINSASQPTDVTGNQALLSSFRVETIEGVGHWVHLEAPERFFALLDTVLPTLGPRPPAPAGPLVHRLSPILVVEDVASVGAFYTDSLGFEVALRTPLDEALPPTLYSLRRDDVSLVVQSRESFDREFADLRGGTEGVPGAAVPPLFLKVASLDRVMSGLQENVRIALPIRTRETGSRQIVLRDPAGTLVIVQESPRVTSGG